MYFTLIIVELSSLLSLLCRLSFFLSFLYFLNFAVFYMRWVELRRWKYNMWSSSSNCDDNIFKSSALRWCSAKQEITQNYERVTTDSLRRPVERVIWRFRLARFYCERGIRVVLKKRNRLGVGLEKKERRKWNTKYTKRNQNKKMHRNGVNYNNNRMMLRPGTKDRLTVPKIVNNMDATSQLKHPNEEMGLGFHHTLVSTYIFGFILTLEFDIFFLP